LHEIGVEPLPLFEWRIFGTFVSGQKYDLPSADGEIFLKIKKEVIPI